jgi:hypothetical protein
MAFRALIPVGDDPPSLRTACTSSARPSDRSSSSRARQPGVVGPVDPLGGGGEPIRTESELSLGQQSPGGQVGAQITVAGKEEPCQESQHQDQQGPEVVQPVPAVRRAGHGQRGGVRPQGRRNHCHTSIDPETWLPRNVSEANQTPEAGRRPPVEDMIADHR